MAVTYNVAVKTARMTATRNHFANGTLELLSASDQVLAIFGLSTSGGTVSGDTWTLEFDATEVDGLPAASTGTTATKARVKTSGGAAHLTGLTVGLAGSGADVIMTNTSISSGQEVGMVSATFQHAT